MEASVEVFHSSCCQPGALQRAMSRLHSRTGLEQMLDVDTEKPAGAGCPQQAEPAHTSRLPHSCLRQAGSPLAGILAPLLQV